MKKLIYFIRKIVIGLCILYGFNVLVSKSGLAIPINYITILTTSIFGLPGIISLLILKKII